MKFVQLKQNTPEWLEFRKSHIGASDSSVIMGCNPYKTINELVAEKVHGLSQPMNDKMQRGKDLEPLALSEFERIVGGLYSPAIVIHSEYEWCMASLDGIEMDGKYIVEIKCPGKKNHTLAKKGKVPDEYYPQLQHQLACTGLEWIYYFSYSEGDNALLKIERDNPYIETMLHKQKQFYEEHLFAQ